MMIDEASLRTSLDELAERPAPPAVLDAQGAIARGRRLVRRRRGARASGAVAGLALAGVLAATLLPGHGRAPQAVAPATASASAPPLKIGPGGDPLTLSGTFGWLPDDAQGLGYSIHPGPNGTPELQALARGKTDMTASPPVWGPMIWLTVYPKGVTPPLGKFSDDVRQLRIDAPDVNGHTAYWMSEKASDPTNGGDSWLRWQDADGQWGELHAYYLTKDDITATLLRVASGVDFAPHAVALPLHITGIPASAKTDDAELDRPGLSDPNGWEVHLALTADGGMVQITVFPTTAQDDATELATKPKPVCKHQNGLTGCVSVTGHGFGSAQKLLSQLTLTGTDPAGWTTHVVAP